MHDLSKSQQQEKIISFFLYTGLVFGLLYVYFAQERLYSSMTNGSIALGPEKFLRIFSVICIFITTFLSIFSSKGKYAVSIFFSYSILLLAITLNYAISGADFSDMAQFMSNRGIGTWICLGVIFVGHHNKRYETFKKFALISAIFISGLCIYNFFDFGVGLWRGQALSKYRVYATNMVWIAPYVFLILKNNNEFKWARVFVLFMGVLMALITQTRSFLLIYILTLLFDFFNTKKKGSYLILLFTGILGFVYLVLNTSIFKQSLDLLINRGTNDTRSEQLHVFLNQLNFIDLVTGKGHFAYYQLGNEVWTAVDNQWLYLLWWGGLIPFLCYFFLAFVAPIILILKGNLDYETRVECFVLVLWVLGLTGLAIYSTMSVEFFFFTMSIILGRVLYKFSLSKTH